MLNERLLTIEWQQRELPELDAVDAGSWLLVSISDRCGRQLADRVGRCVETSTARNARPCRGPGTPSTADAERLRDQLDSGRFTGLVVLAATGPEALATRIVP